MYKEAKCYHNVSGFPAENLQYGKCQDAIEVYSK